MLTSPKCLGDGFYEQRLIQQAIIARTGQRFIDGITSDTAMFQYLMDNAIGSKQALNLSVGVSLTAEQVAALTHDIVWMENATVAGQQVLVPVLYLAQTNNRLAPNGALITVYEKRESLYRRRRCLAFSGSLPLEQRRYRSEVA